MGTATQSGSRREAGVACLQRAAFAVAVSGFLAIAGLPAAGWSQTPVSASIATSAEPSTQETTPTPAISGTSASAAAPVSVPAPSPRTFTVPAGTKVLLQLRSAINTKSAKAGDGVYLASTFPVVVGNRVMIPAGVYVQGTVDRVLRAGRVKGRAQLDMHFSSIIFPNGTVVEIPGMVNALPGAKQQSVKDNGEGTIEQAGDKGRHAGEVAKIAIPTGGTIGSIGGLEGGHPIVGGLVGVAAGLATTGIVALFTRGADVDIASGTQVEMVLQRPLLLEEANLSVAGPDGTSSAGLVPSSSQPRPLDKPGIHHARVICPPGSLGCE
jgi:hypothetical protein